MKPTERQVQRAILRMAGICFPDMLIAHVPNGAHLAGDSTARFKQMGALLGDGLKRGWPDLICVWRGGVALLEVKRPGGRLTGEQPALHAQLAAIGHAPEVVTSPGEAFAALVDRGAVAKVQWGGVA